MEMYADDKISGRFVGLEHVMEEGKFLLDMGCTILPTSRSTRTPLPC